MVPKYSLTVIFLQALEMQSLYQKHYPNRPSSDKCECLIKMPKITETFVYSYVVVSSIICIGVCRSVSKKGFRHIGSRLVGQKSRDYPGMS